MSDRFSTLFPKSYNWLLFICFSIVLRILLIDLSWFCFFALIVSIFQFSLLFLQFGKLIPTRHLFGALLCLQFLVGPTLAYNGLDEYQYFMYRMKIPEHEYFLYAFPAVIFFIIGLHLRAGNAKGEMLDLDEIRTVISNNRLVAPILIGVGFFASIVSNYFSSDLAFVFYLIGSFKFIGLFIIVLSEKRVNYLALVLVVGSIVFSSLGSGMFHDLLTWIIFLAAVFAIKYEVSNFVKMIGLVIFIFIATIIQLLKSDYRVLTSIDENQAGFETFAKVYQQENMKEGVFNFQKLAQSNVRINQGFIVTNIMFIVPEKEPFANGDELKDILKAAFLPRILAPDKLKAGDRSLFRKYSGIPITQGTSMGLSSIGDAYINFGIMGGIVFMFFLGLMYSEVLVFFFNIQSRFPLIILFSPLIFYYPIRPDCELQTILGHLVKSIFIVFTTFYIWRNVFLIKSTENIKHADTSEH